VAYYNCHQCIGTDKDCNCGTGRTWSTVTKKCACGPNSASATDCTCKKGYQLGVGTPRTCTQCAEGFKAATTCYDYETAECPAGFVGDINCKPCDATTQYCNCGPNKIWSGKACGAWALRASTLCHLPLLQPAAGLWPGSVPPLLQCAARLKQQLRHSSNLVLHARCLPRSVPARRQRCRLHHLRPWPRAQPAANGRRSLRVMQGGLHR
jgi:hypothetical protein